MERTVEFEIEVELDGETFRFVGSHTQDGNHADDDFQETFDFDRGFMEDAGWKGEMSRWQREALVGKYRIELEDAVRDYERVKAEQVESESKG